MLKKIVLLLLLFPISVFAADTEVQDLDAISSPATGDVLYVVDDPSGTPASKKITIGNLLGVANDLDSNGDVADNSHSHQAANISDQNAGTDITADLEEETHASEHGVGGNDSIFPADPNADRLPFWDDDPGEIAWLDYSGWDLNSSDDVTASTDLSDTADLVRTSDIGTSVLAPDGDGSSLSGVVTSESDPIVGAIDGLVKADGEGAISAAVADTDYLTPTGDGSGLSGVVTSESDPNALLTAGTDNVKNTHIDWGSEVGQVDTDDMPEGSVNLYSTLTNIQSACTSDFHNIGGTDDDVPDNDEIDLDFAIGDSVDDNLLAQNLIKITAGDSYSNFGDSDDDTLDELFAAIDTAIGGLGGGHDALTLSAGADTMLSLSTQELQLDSTLGDTEIFIGTGAGTGNWAALSGDATMTNAGVVTVSTSAACSGTSAVAATVTITDNEDTAENNPLVFVADADPDGGNLGLETDGTCYYTPSTGVITATGFAGALTGNVTGNCSGSSGSCTGNAATATTASNVSDADYGEITVSGGVWTVEDSLTVTGWALGASTATTPAADDNDTSLATTAFCETTQNYLKTSEFVGANEAYAAGWNSDTSVPEKDDIYDYLHNFDADDDGSFTDESWYTAVLLKAGGTMTGDVQLGETVIKLDATLSGDSTWSGITISGTAGATIAVGDLCYLNNDDSRWELADANLSDGYDKMLGICVLAGNDGDTTEMLIYGKVRSAVFPAFTVGSPLYMSETAGDVTHTAPTTTDACVRVLGFSLTAEDFMFMPSNNFYTHT